MKKNLLLFILLFFEAIFVILFTISQSRSAISSAVPFTLNMWNGIKAMSSAFGKFIHLDVALSDFPPRLYISLSLLIINIINIIIYEIIASLIVLIVRKNYKKKLVANKLDAYELTEEEKAKFSWKLYQKHFPWLSILSFLIPTAFILLFIFVRFDKVICEEDKYSQGILLVYTSSIEPFIKSFSPNLNQNIIDFAHNYISLMNSIYDVVKYNWVEYIIVIAVIILVYLVWIFLVWLINKMFRKSRAKSRAKKARKKYIAKMEKIELKARKSAGERISSKARDINVNFDDNNSIYEDVSVISIKSDYMPTTFSDSRNAEYLDDIGTGVIDLGIALTGEEEGKEPIEKKIPVFVGEEDVDIVLEKEPIVETIEEDTSEEEFAEDDFEPFFEKYDPNNIDTSYLDDSVLNEQVTVYAENENPHEEGKNIIEQYIESRDKKIKVEFKKEDSENSNDVLINDLTINNIDKIKEEDEEKNTQELLENKSIQKTEEFAEDKKPLLDTDIVNEKEKVIVPIDPLIVKEEIPQKEEEINKEEAIQPIKFIPKKEGLKKPIKPIEITINYDAKERFKNARQKYFSFSNKEVEKKKKEEIKKRNRIRRIKKRS